MLLNNYLNIILSNNYKYCVPQLSIAQKYNSEASSKYGEGAGAGRLNISKS